MVSASVPSRSKMNARTGLTISPTLKRSCPACQAPWRVVDSPSRVPSCPTCQTEYPPGMEICPRDGGALSLSAAETLTEAVLGSAPTLPERPGAAAEAAPATKAQLEERFDSLLGVVLAGRYEVLRRIGEGGMGAVYEARHTLIGKRVAVKVLLEKFHTQSDLVARLLQEARLASSIGHENIVDVTDFGTTDDGRSFVV